MIFCQVLVNIGMATGSLPVVGITLPFFSYGGSSLLASMLAVGLLMNISMRRFTF
jgi:rod shape determining protein RodA